MIGGGVGVVLASLAIGQHCGSSAASYGGGYAASYSYTPSYNYGYAAATYVPYVEKIKFVAVEAPYQDAYYSSLIGGQVRQEYAKQAQNQALDALTKELQQLRATVTQLQQPPPAEIQRFDQPQSYAPAPAPAPTFAPSPQQAAPPAFVPVPSPQQAFRPPQKTVPSKDAPGLPYNSAPAPPEINPIAATENPGGVANSGGVASLYPVMAGRCMKCHQYEKNPGGGLALFDAKGNPIDLSISELSKIFGHVNSGLMPKGGVLSPEERAAFEPLRPLAGLIQQASR